MDVSTITTTMTEAPGAPAPAPVPSIPSAPQPAVDDNKHIPGQTLHDRIHAEAVNKLQSQQNSQPLTATTATTTGAPPNPFQQTTPASTPTTAVTAPVAPTTPTTPTATTEFVDDFVLNLDDDGDQPPQPSTVDNTTQPAQPVQPVPSAAVPLTAAPGASADESPRPESFTEEEWKVVEKYRQLPASQVVRQQAKMIREISKQPENGGLGFTPTPQEVVQAFNMANNLRTMVDHFQSGDPNTANLWAQNWLFQMGRDQQGQYRPQVDEHGVPMLRPGATQAVQSMVQHMTTHPETVNLLAAQIPDALQKAVSSNVPGAQEAYIALGNSYFSKLIQSYEAAIPNVLAGKTITVTGADGQPVQVSGADMVSKVLGYMKQDLGLDKPADSTTDDPEKARLRKELDELRNRGKQTRTQQIQQHVSTVSRNLESTVLSKLDADVDRRLQPLRAHLTSTVGPDAEIEYNVIRNGLKQVVMDTLKANPGFNNRYKQTLIDVRNGLDHNQLGMGLVRAAREAYNEVLTRHGAALIKSRLSQAAQRNGAIQSTMQQNAAANSAPLNTGRPAVPNNTAGQPGAMGSNGMQANGQSQPSSLPPMERGETLQEWTRRVMPMRLSQS